MPRRGILRMQHKIDCNRIQNPNFRRRQKTLNNFIKINLELQEKWIYFSLPEDKERGVGYLTTALQKSLSLDHQNQNLLKPMVKQISLFLVVVCMAGYVHAQVEPSNIYLFEMRRTSDTTYAFNNPQWLTFFNESGYNNQPAFFGLDKLYITVQEPGDNQTDLYELDLRNETRCKVTETPEGEYSPQLMPTRYQFSAVRQEISGRDTLLRLWQFPTDRLSNGKPIFKYINGIGYYHWLNSTQIVIYMVDNPSRLELAKTDTDDTQVIASNVGRCFKRMRNGNLAFVQKNDFDNWYIMEKKLNVRNTRGGYSRSRFRSNTRPSTSSASSTVPLEDLPLNQVIETLPGSEDFEVLPDGSFLMALGSKLFRYNPRRDEDWREIADFRYHGIRNITRLAISRDSRLAVVAN